MKTCRIGSVILLLVILSFPVACRNQDSADGTASRPTGNAFIDAFKSGKYSDALALVEKKLKENPASKVELTYKGSCLAMLKRYEEAVETFMLAEPASDNGFVDKTGLYLRALALFNVKTYCRAQQVLDSLAKKFPLSRTAKKGQELALKIDERLAAGVSDGNLKWYLQKGFKAFTAERPALAAEYLGEYLLLNGRSGKKIAGYHKQALFYIGGAFLEMSRPSRAIEYLREVPPGFGSYRAGIMTAIALKAGGRTAEALEMLEKIISKTENETVRKRARKYLKNWTSE